MLWGNKKKKRQSIPEGFSVYIRKCICNGEETLIARRGDERLELGFWTCEKEKKELLSSYGLTGDEIAVSFDE